MSSQIQGSAKVVDHRFRAEELLHIANTATVTNHDGENPEGALLIAEAQVHATLAVAQALEPAEWAAPAKPTGWVYRITVDKYPTPDGRPFIDQSESFYMEQVYLHANPDEGEMAPWLPESFGEWIYTDEYPSEPAKVGRTIWDGGDEYHGNSGHPILKVPFTRRRHWLSASTARGIVAGLREWGAEVRLERCPLDAWEVVA